MNTYDEKSPPSDFIDGFAAGAELSRQSAFVAWMRYSAWMLNGSGALDVIELRDEEEGKGFDNGVRLGRRYTGKPEQPRPMTAEQHNKHPKGRWADESRHCVNCLRWEGKHWQERGRCSLLLIPTARLSTCERFQPHKPL